MCLEMNHNSQHLLSALGEPARVEYPVSSSRHHDARLEAVRLGAVQSSAETLGRAKQWKKNYIIV